MVQSGSIEVTGVGMRHLRETIAAVALLVLLCLGGCAAAPFYSEGVTYEGKNLSVVLEENATTGYRWAYVIEGFSLRAAGDEYLAESNEKGAVGVGGLHAFKFEGVGVGTTQILFTNAQQWQGGEVGDSVVVDVEVGQNGTIISAQQKADAH
ncbi:MAG: protease inhibitor I42 family protein [Raoultibacter sp.]